MKRFFKELFCRHNWYYQNGSISEVKCEKCDKKDTFFPW